jgi:hypothetical protein
MSNKPRRSSKKEEQEIELRPDGWRQFERAIDAAIKSGPIHKVAPKPKTTKRTSGKGRARIGESKR